MQRRWIEGEHLAVEGELGVDKDDATDLVSIWIFQGHGARGEETAAAHAPSTRSWKGILGIADEP